MKRRDFIRAGVVSSTFAILKTQTPIIVLEAAMKCVSIILIGGVGAILYRCGAKAYLVRYQEDGSPDWYCASMARVQSLGEGGRRCEGPWPDMAEPKRRALINNAAISEGLPIIYPCGPLGDIPGPLSMTINLHMSTDGATYSKVSSVLGTTDNCMFFVSFNADKSALSRTDQRQISDCDAVVPGIVPASAFFRMNYEAIS